MKNIRWPMAVGHRKVAKRPDVAIGQSAWCYKGCSITLLREGMRERIWPGHVVKVRLGSWNVRYDQRTVWHWTSGDAQKEELQYSPPRCSNNNGKSGRSTSRTKKNRSTLLHSSRTINITRHRYIHAHRVQKQGKGLMRRTIQHPPDPHYSSSSSSSSSFIARGHIQIPNTNNWAWRCLLQDM